MNNLNFGEKCCLEQLLSTHVCVDNSAAGDRHNSNERVNISTSIVAKLATNNRCADINRTSLVSATAKIDVMMSSHLILL
jgi:hypothetical protein